MHEEAKKYLKDGWTANHLGSCTKGTWAQTDITTYEVKDENGKFVGNLIVTEDCSLRTLDTSVQVHWENLQN